ncbi:MAG: AAA family ATPase [Bacteroidota bacterium]
MVTRVRLVNFKNHADTTIELGRMTALLGPNGVGKTSVLQGVHHVTSRPEHGVNNYDYSILRIGAPHCKVTLHVSQSDLAQPAFLEHFLENSQDGWDSDNRTGWGEDSAAPTPLWHLYDRYKSTLLRLTPQALKRPSYVELIPPRLEPDGTGLASVIQFIVGDRLDDFITLQSVLKSVVSVIEGVRVKPYRMPDIGHREARPRIGQKLFFDTKSGAGVPAEAISDGSIVTLGILAAIFSHEEPDLLLIDDVEQGLHPEAQRELIQQLRKLLDVFPELQIVMTTHSPYVADELEPEEIYLIKADTDGIAQAKRLSEHPDAHEALKLLTTGEFWSAVGEDWVLEAANASA